MKTFADVKRRAIVGATLTMTQYVVNGKLANGPLVGLPRKIKLVQTNAIQFEPHKPGSDGSWLFWTKASEVTINDANTFTIEGDIALTYRFD